MVELNPLNLMSLKVTELRAELKKRGQLSSGLKPVLAARLKDILLEEQKSEDVTEESAAEEEEGEDETDVPAVPEEKAASEVTKATEETLKQETSVEATKELANDSDKAETEQSIEPAPTTETETAESTLGKESAQAVGDDKVVSEDAVPGSDDVTESMEGIQKEEPKVVAQPAEISPDPSAPTTLEAPPAPLPEAMAQDYKPTEKELETQDETVSSGDASAEKRMSIQTGEDIEMVAPPVVDAASNKTSTLAVKNMEVIPTDEITPLPDDTPPQTIVVESMDVDPIDKLKRKRRSASPPPLLPDGTEAPREDEKDTSPSKAKRPRGESFCRDARFKGLFNDSTTPVETANISDEDQATSEPSLWRTERALYIRNLVRPLQEPALKAHIQALATRNGTDMDNNLIQTFYLDAIKSHAFIIMENSTACRRIRRGIHDKVFPVEKTRKPLWADFVPPECVEKWIAQEKELGGRWEVFYHPDRETEPELVEAGSATVGRGSGRTGTASVGVGTGASAGRARGSVDMSNAPTGPKRASEVGSAPKTVGKKIVMNLDQLFKSTTTKPKLYYLPVPEDIALARLTKEGRDATGRRL